MRKERYLSAENSDSKLTDFREFTSILITKNSIVSTFPFHANVPYKCRIPTSLFNIQDIYFFKGIFQGSVYQRKVFKRKM